jgi:hypothetical protein
MELDELFEGRQPRPLGLREVRKRMGIAPLGNIQNNPSLSAPLKAAYQDIANRKPHLDKYILHLEFLEEMKK